MTSVYEKPKKQNEKQLFLYVIIVDNGSGPELFEPVPKCILADSAAEARVKIGQKHATADILEVCIAQLPLG